MALNKRGVITVFTSLSVLDQPSCPVFKLEATAQTNINISVVEALSRAKFPLSRCVPASLKSFFW